MVVQDPTWAGKYIGNHGVPRTMRRLAALSMVFLSGCVGMGEGPTILLEYSLESLSGGQRDASLGPHCGTAIVEGDHVEVERKAYKGLGKGRPFLIVEPGNVSGFSSIGTEAFPAAFPTMIDPWINGTSSSLAALDYRDGQVLVDGRPVGLPHNWTNEKPGDWRAAFRLSEGPNAVRTFEMGSCM